jgi:hypothetical protein
LWSLILIQRGYGEIIFVNYPADKKFVAHNVHLKGSESDQTQTTRFYRSHFTIGFPRIYISDTTIISLNALYFTKIAAAQKYAAFKMQVRLHTQQRGDEAPGYVRLLLAQKTFSRIKIF